MSIESVTEMKMKGGGTRTLDKLTSFRIFRVVMDTASNEDEFLIYNHSSIPNIRTAHPGNSAIRAVAITPTVVSDDGLHWDVVVAYENVPNKGGDESTDPTDEPANVHVRFQRYAEVAETSYLYEDPEYAPDDLQDLPTRPIVNSAGQPFDPPIMANNNRIVLRIRKNTRNYDPEEARSFIDTVNKDQIAIVGISIPPLCALMLNYEGQTQWDVDGDLYYAVVWEIEVDFKTYVRKILDTGFYELDSAGVLTSIQVDGEDATSPLKLDGNGAVLEGGASVGDAVYLDFDIYYPKQWGGIDLPTNFEDK